MFDESSYRSSKSAYQLALHQAKYKAWSDFWMKASTCDTFKLLSFFTGKTKSISITSQIVVNGSLTSDSAVIVIFICAQHFFHEELPT